MSGILCIAKALCRATESLPYFVCNVSLGNSHQGHRTIHAGLETSCVDIPHCCLWLLYALCRMVRVGDTRERGGKGGNVMMGRGGGVGERVRGGKRERVRGGKVRGERVKGGKGERVRGERGEMVRGGKGERVRGGKREMIGGVGKVRREEREG